ncbi:glutaredoxin domain-containing cysteine-rich protein CG31559-like [Cimex lectularius]|uniref:Glutaredoxin domain-containing protein n=1 Tax=Cimex lectularius TaxID=79782 RepID=A0A8I6RV08_CIMLE|nr:glutaredoxin domain-containing cysteine-rich protein CG31559-like [Cimex lectularius]
MMSVKPTTVLIKSSKTGSLSVGKGPSGNGETGKHVVRIKLEESNVVGDSCSVRITIRSGSDEDNNNMLYKGEECLCQLKGESPASEAADSGTCSDLDGTTPPPNHRHRTIIHSDDDDDDISSDSLSDTDRRSPPGFLPFHLNENDFEKHSPSLKDDGFTGRHHGLHGESGTIKSSRGTIRGVKNRVRASIATFLQLDNNKTWQEKEKGTLVVYTTTMGVIRATYLRCLKARHILRTNMIKYTEKDVFMSKSFQNELKERLGTDSVSLPQIFLEGSHLGDVEVLEKMNETGELRSILQPYRSKEACTTCQVCGDFRLLPCNVCNGSKKSVHRNQFSTELVSLRCMHCDEAGLVKCYAC